MTDRELFDRALDLPAPERLAFLDAHCPDPAARARVQSLLDAHDQAGDFLDRSAGEPRQPVTPWERWQTATAIAPWPTPAWLPDGVMRGHRASTSIAMRNALRLTAKPQEAH